MQNPRRPHRRARTSSGRLKIHRPARSGSSCHYQKATPPWWRARWKSKSPPAENFLPAATRACRMHPQTPLIHLGFSAPLRVRGPYRGMRSSPSGAILRPREKSSGRSARSSRHCQDEPPSQPAGPRPPRHGSVRPLRLPRSQPAILWHCHAARLTPSPE